MVPRRKGLIVNISSLGGKTFFQTPLYGIGKAGVSEPRFFLEIYYYCNGKSIISYVRLDLVKIGALGVQVLRRTKHLTFRRLVINLKLM